MNNNFQEHFDTVFFRARKVLLEEEPFFAYLLNQCAIREDSKAKTIAIMEEHGIIYIVYSHEWTETLTEKQAAEVIKHVLSHLVFGHLASSKEEDDPTHDTAMDLAVNTCVVQDNLPKGFVKPSDFGFDEGLSTYGYYGKLPKSKKGPKGGKKEGDKKGKKKGGKGGKGGNSGTQGDNHEFMKISTGESNVQNQVRKMVTQADQQAGSKKPASWGDGVCKLLSLLLQPPEIPWNMVLRQFVAFCSRYKKISTWKKPNRRFGEEMPGVKRKPQLTVLVGLDESGSVSDHEWEKLMSEVDGIYKTGAKVILCKFTAVVEKVMEYTGVDEDVRTRFQGGTNFQPVFDVAEEMRPDCLIMLTDGENFDSPITYSRTSSVLWVLTPQHRVPESWGTSIVIKDLGKKEDLYW